MIHQQKSEEISEISKSHYQLISVNETNMAVSS